MLSPILHCPYYWSYIKIAGILIKIVLNLYISLGRIVKYFFHMNWHDHVILSSLAC